MRTRTVAARGLDFAVTEAGDPQPDDGRRLLFAHGFTGAKEDFTDWFGPVADLGWHVAALDLRGHGASDKPAGLDAYALRVLADDVLAVADGLRWDRFVLFGHSMGGMAAQHAALMAPTRLAALILMATSPGRVDRVERQVVELACAIVAAGGMEALARAQAERESPLATPAGERVLAERPGHAEFSARKFLATAPDAYRALAMEMLDQPDRLGALASLGLPVLVIAGEQDRVFLEPCELLAAAIPGAVLEVVPDAGHSPQFENPSAWWDALSRFLKEVGR
ncbi:MAG: alpha/beta fold hydrolase [Acidimicrobiales bacterium]